jgi:hypothetical protein
MDPSFRRLPPRRQEGKRHVTDDDERLMPAHERAKLLDYEIRQMELNGYLVETRPTRSLVVMTRNGRRVQLFVDEHGELQWP